jgi:4-hydroxyproline epimerase
MFRRIQIIDSHTGGEPTRVVVGGGPDLGGGSLAERAARLRQQFDRFRSAVVCEPRGSEVIVGALLCPPLDPQAAAGVIFFNNVGTIGMCGHGTIGVVTTLAHLGHIGPGQHKLETVVGDVTARLHADGRVSFDNVPSYRAAAGVTVDVPGYGTVTGDVAWGGNWFFLVGQHGERIALENVERLGELTWAIRQALRQQGVGGDEGREIDHIELFGPPTVPGADSKNFVLCPGRAYDRSPCGTGTSAKLACLAAEGKLRPGQVWRQESIVGSLFEGEIVSAAGRQIVPRITGRAHLTAEATLLVDPEDPFAEGIGTQGLGYAEA